MSIEYFLILANNVEIDQYETATCGSGLDNTLLYLANDPLAKKELGKPRGYDHIHLSVPDTNKQLVRWYGRGSSGYHYPIGSVMKMVKK